MYSVFEEGCNENFLKSLTKTENGEYVVSLKYPVLFPVLKECQVPETRRQLKIAFDKRCVDVNTGIFEEILELRTKLASTLGFKNFSEYQLSLLCAKNPQTVDTFLTRLSEKLIHLQRKEMDILLNYKKIDVKLKQVLFHLKSNIHQLKHFLFDSVKSWTFHSMAK